jgi:hypothetical protein
MHANNSRDVRGIRNARNVGNTSGRRDDNSRRKAAIAETTAMAGTQGTKQKRQLEYQRAPAIAGTAESVETPEHNSRDASNRMHANNSRDVRKHQKRQKC